MRFLDAETGRLLEKLPNAVKPNAIIAWSPAGDRLSAAYDKELAILDRPTGKSLVTCLGHEATNNFHTWSPDGTLLATGSQDKTVRVWDAINGQEVGKSAFNEPVLDVAWSRGGKLLAVALAQELVLLSLDAKQIISRHILPARFGGGSAGQHGLSWSSDDSFLTCCCYAYPLLVLDVASGKVEPYYRHVALQPNNFVMAWSPSGKLIATAAEDGTIRLWDEQLKLRRVLPGDFSITSMLEWSRDGRYLASLHDRQLLLWDVSNSRLLRKIELPLPMISLAWIPDAAQLAVGFDGRWALVDARTGELDEFWSPGQRVTWSPDGRRIAAGYSLAMTIWDVQSRVPLSVWQVPPEVTGLGALSWSPDGRRVATGARAGVLRIFDPDQVEPLHSCPHGGLSVCGLAWSADSQQIATIVAADNSLSIWNATTGQLVREVGKFNLSEVSRLDWSRDGTKFAISRQALPTLEIDAQSGAVRELTDQGWRALWSPNGDRFASAHPTVPGTALERRPLTLVVRDIRRSRWRRPAVADRATQARQNSSFFPSKLWYNSTMTTTIDSTAFNRGTDPILQFITVDQAREIVEFRGDAELRQRIDQLAERANEGELTAEERAEYEGYVHANKFVAIFQAKARKLLSNSVS